MTIPEMVLAVQKELKLALDGKAGPQTWGAIYRAIVLKDLPPHPSPSDISAVDARSETNIQTLHPLVRPMARALVHAGADQGIDLRVTSGSRTYEEQNALWDQGRNGQPGKIVTHAKAGHSSHNFGIAFDVTIFMDGIPVWESPLYKVVGSLGRGIGLEWGGDWESLQDEPHFQVKPAWASGLKESAMLAGLRARHNEGRDIFA